MKKSVIIWSIVILLTVVVAGLLWMFKSSETKVDNEPLETTIATNEAGKNTIDSVPADENRSDSSILDEKTCTRFAMCIPDHALRKDARVYFTAEYLKAWDNIISMPDLEGYATGKSESDWLFYFVTANGDCEKLKAHILNIIEQDSCAKVTLCYTCSAEEQISSCVPHTINLIKSDNQWLIDDYDGTKQRMTDWVNRSLETFCSGLWKEYFEDTKAMIEYEEAMGYFVSQMQ